VIPRLSSRTATRNNRSDKNTEKKICHRDISSRESEEKPEGGKSIAIFVLNDVPCCEDMW
jgi:hypothetical protein